MVEKMEKETKERRNSRLKKEDKIRVNFFIETTVAAADRNESKAKNLEKKKIFFEK